MTNAELIAKIKTEIDKRYAEYREKMKSDDFTYYEGMADALDLFEQFIDSLESEKPINLDDAMKELDEKIALVKERGTWDGVDVDKYMDEVRGREPEKPMELEEEVKRYYSDNFEYISSDQPTLSILTNIARHFAQWQKEQMMKEAIGGNAYPNDGEIWVDLARYGYKFKEGEPCRIIIVKEEEDGQSD